MKNFLLKIVLYVLCPFAMAQDITDVVVTVSLCETTTITSSPPIETGFNNIYIPCSTTPLTNTIDFYQITIESGTTFTFAITPNTDLDYDWASWLNPDLTNLGIADRGSQNHPAISGIYETGISLTAPDLCELPGTSGDPEPGFVRYYDVQPGDIVIIAVNKWSEGNSGYTISFGGNTVETACPLIMEKCDDDYNGEEDFDLDEVITELQSIFINHTAILYDTFENAEEGSGTGLLTGIYTAYVVDNPTLIYARVEDENGNFVKVHEVHFYVFPTPVVGTPPTIFYCTSTGSSIGMFNLTFVEEEIVDDVEELIFSYYTTWSGAEEGGTNNQITNPTSYFGPAGTVYLRVENEHGCYVVREIPLVITQGNLQEQHLVIPAICIDEIEGIIDLTSHNEELTDENYLSYQYEYYLNESDAQSGNTINAISDPNNFPVISGNTYTIYVRIVIGMNCAPVISSLTFTVDSIPNLLIDNLIETCSGSTVILEAGTEEDNTVNWYESEDSEIPVHIGNPYEIEDILENMTIWVEAANGECKSERVAIEITVHPFPELTIESPVEVCTGTTAIIEVETAEGNTVNWYDTPTGVTPVFVGNPFETPELTGTTSYWVEVTNEEGCTSERIEVVVEVTDSIVPIFDLEEQYCLDSEETELPTESENGITGTWMPTTINTSIIGTQSYTFTPDEGQCAEEYTVEIEITDTIESEFDIENQYCLNSEETQLPTESDNGITGTWMPTTINTSTTGTQIYTFTPDEDQCAEEFTIEIEITDTIEPEFEIGTEYCLNSTPGILPPTSDNNITGTWTPSTIDTGTTGIQTYTFTPDEGQCAEVFTLEIEIVGILMPEFDLQTVYCINATPDILHPTSGNGITGTWEPSVINTSTPGTQTYTFTPDDGQGCAGEIQIEIEITEEIIPEFNIQNQYCLNSTPDILPPTSDNGIMGTWIPSIIDTGTLGIQTYTFTPEIDCAEEIQIEITISETIIPQFTNLPESYCLNTSPDILHPTSDNGITGTWFPSEIDTSIQGITVYTFTPNEDQCGEEYQLTVTVYPHPEMDLEEKIVICEGDSYTYTAPEGFDSYLWTNQQNQIISQTQEVTFTQEGLYTLTVEINGIPCQLSRNIEVSFSQPPTIIEIKTTQNTLTVYATGGIPMEYSMNQVFWQSSPTFTNLEPGIYHVYVRDAEGCSTAAKMAGLLGVPNFISPNGDGYNDTWEIRALEAYPNTRLQVFDRYGKIFVDRTLTGDFKWDGKYNGQPLPSGSYWYILILENGEKISGHISIRNGRP